MLKLIVPLIHVLVGIDLQHAKNLPGELQRGGLVRGDEPLVNHRLRLYEEVLSAVSGLLPETLKIVARVFYAVKKPVLPQKYRRAADRGDRDMQIVDLSHKFRF